jgi:hypothetical protein
LSDIFLYPRYSSAQDYKGRTGQEAPWDPRKRPKYWFDPKAPQSARRNVVYDLVLAISDTGTIIADLSGNPILEYLVITKEEAGSVNIPPANYSGEVQLEYPVPLRPLADNEVLVFGRLPGMVGNQVLVADKSELETGPDAFLRSDRALLKAIASKLGVEV